MSLSIGGSPQKKKHVRPVPSFLDKANNFLDAIKTPLEKAVDLGVFTKNAVDQLRERGVYSVINGSGPNDPRASVESAPTDIVDYISRDPAAPRKPANDKPNMWSMWMPPLLGVAIVAIVLIALRK